MTDFTNYLIPQISWSQNEEYIILVIELVKTSDNNYDIKDDAIFLTCKSNNKLYKVDFVLYDTIKSEESTYISYERYARFLLRKSSSEKWVRITKDKNTYKSNIKVNWSDFDDSDGDEPDNTGQPGMDFSSMMGGGGGMDLASMMGGGGGMDFASMMGGRMDFASMIPDGMGEVDDDNEFNGDCGESNIEEDTLDKPLESIDLSEE
jgi:hypothetical protein